MTPASHARTRSAAPRRTSRTRISTALGVLALGTALLAPDAAAQSDAPAGNNGSIKIDDVALDDGNESVAHPGCTFVVDLFGYDVGTRSATLTFAGQEPTAGGELLVDTITFEVVSRETGNQLDTSRTIDLSDALVGIAPHPKQGWHVKLSVSVDGAQGADVKHKVFWVSECSSTALAASQAAVDLEHDTALWSAALKANAERELAASAAQPAAARATVAAAAAQTQLPRTGFTTSLTWLGVALVACGLLALHLSKRGAARVTDGRRWTTARFAGRGRRAVAGALLMTTATLLAAVGPAGILPAGAAIVATVELATAGSYSVLAGSAVTNTGPSTTNADLGTSPGSAVTGFPPGIIGGTLEVANAASAEAQDDLTLAYVNAAGRPVDETTTADLVDLILVGGVYSAPAKGPLSLTGPLVLDGEGNSSSVFIFQTNSTLTTASGSVVTLINGAKACNVFWQVGSSATLGTGSTFVGSVLALTSITVTTDVTIRGRMLARNGAVTLDDDRILSGACSSTTTTSGSGSGSGSGATTSTTAATTTSTTAATTTSTTAATSTSTTSSTSTTAVASTATTQPAPPVTAVGAAAPRVAPPLDAATVVPTATTVVIDAASTTPTTLVPGGGLQELPRTGVSAGVLTMVALGLIALGAIAVNRGRAAER